MINVRDERKEYGIGTCINCNKEGAGRHIQHIGWMGEIRDNPFVCFECHKPRIFWKPHGKYSKVICSPISLNQYNEFLKKI